MGWNVWSKFIYPKPNVRIAVCFTLVDNEQAAIHGFFSESALEGRHALLNLVKPAVRLEAVNLGPGEVHLDTAIFANGGYLHSRKHGYHLMSAYANYPYDLSVGAWGTASMAGLIKPGQKVQLFFPATLALFDTVKIKRMGFSDSFARIHFCPRKSMRQLERVARLYFAKVHQ